MANRDAMPAAETDVLLTPGEVARLFRVTTRTVTRWARSGRLHAVLTLGGHRRFHRSEVLGFLDAQERAPLL